MNLTEVDITAQQGSKGNETRNVNVYTKVALKIRAIKDRGGNTRSKKIFICITKQVNLVKSFYNRRRRCIFAAIDVNGETLLSCMCFFFFFFSPDTHSKTAGKKTQQKAAMTQTVKEQIFRCILDKKHFTCQLVYDMPFQQCDPRR